MFKIEGTSMKGDLAVDIVIPWVDGSDPVWKQDKERYVLSIGKSEGNQESKYRDWELLRFWFRSIERNMDWINKVHFITYGHLPEWLNTSNAKLNIVAHGDYIPDKYLPTFNSHVIELNVHRIPDLAERFVYMNDDTFILDRVDRSIFFDDHGMPRQMMKIMCLDNYDPDVDFCIIDFNNMGLINRNFSIHDFDKRKLFSFKYDLRTNIRNMALPLSYVYPGFCQLHMPAPFLRSTFLEVWDKEERYLDKTCTHKFRHYKDVNQWLMQYWQLVKGDYTPINAAKYSKMFEIGRNDEEMFTALKNHTYKMVCLNDSDSAIDFEKEKRQLIQIMKILYPKRSGYEKEDK